MEKYMKRKMFACGFCGKTMDTTMRYCNYCNSESDFFRMKEYFLEKEKKSRQILIALLVLLLISLAASFYVSMKLAEVQNSEIKSAVGFFSGDTEKLSNASIACWIATVVFLVFVLIAEGVCSGQKATHRLRLDRLVSQSQPQAPMIRPQMGMQPQYCMNPQTNVPAYAVQPQTIAPTTAAAQPQTNAPAYATQPQNTAETQDQQHEETAPQSSSSENSTEILYSTVA